MLTEFFLVKEQDSGPSESMRYKKGKIGDMRGEFVTDDETSKGPLDFRSTFVEVSHHRETGSSIAADKVDPRGPQRNDIVDRPMDAKDETGTRNGPDTKRSDGENAISALVGLNSSQMVSEKDSGKLAVKDLRAKDQMTAPGQANRGQIFKSKTLKGDSLAILEPKRDAASAERGNTKSTLIFSQAYPAKGISGLAQHTVGEANITATASSMSVDGQASADTGKSKVQVLKTAMGAAREKGVAIPGEGSGTVRRGDGRTGGDTGKSQVHDLKTVMSWGNEKRTAMPAEGSMSVKKGDGQISVEPGKSDGAASRGAYGSHGVRVSDQGIEKAWLKSHFSEALALKGGLALKGEFSASEKERPEKHSAGTSKKGSASTGMTSKLSQNGLRSNMGVGEPRETGESHHGKKTFRVDLNRDGRGKADASKVGFEEQTGETTRSKIKEENASAKLATRVSTIISEQGFDRTALKSETTISDNTPFSSSSTSSSTKTPGNISRFAETEMVRRSFQENGVRQLVEKAALNLKNGRQEFRIELKPESLGHVKVQVSTENHQVTIKILTELPVAKEMIENNLHQLKAELQGQGLEIDKFEVSLSQGSDKNGVEHGFTGSKKMKRGFGHKGDSKTISSTPDVEREDLARNQLSGNGAINLFA
jgi:flagellar hook-length control protein FliK